jgi:hypothetical protein
MAVNWFSIEVQNAKGKRTYSNSFVTDLPVTANTVAELAACGRARWKIENETFNVLKTTGYNLEHNFGHGKETLASVLVTLNLLAFAFHTAAYLGVLAWRTAVTARRHLPLLRASANHHHLRRLPGLVPSARLHRRIRSTTTLTRDDDVPPLNPPHQRSHTTDKKATKCEFRIAGCMLDVALI